MRSVQVRQTSLGPTSPGTYRNSDGENQETNEDRSHNDLHPDVGISMNQSSQDIHPEEATHIQRYSFQWNKFILNVNDNGERSKNGNNLQVGEMVVEKFQCS